MKKSLFTVAVIAFMAISFAASASNVAVVVDKRSYEEAREEIDAYLSSISRDGRRGVLLIDEWGVPDSLRSRLMEMYRHSSLEGAVLVGDIPVPMIRDAQHLCSAFKVDQTRDMRRSSVPSDRFYDDFTLSFTFLKRDDKNPLLFYYSLDPDCEQQVSCDIYSSRIKPAQGSDKYRQLRSYFRRVVEIKSRENKLDKALCFAGHGYNSESMFARMEEHRVLPEQIPALEAKGGRLDYIDHSYDEVVKSRLLRALEMPGLDFAILHHHGAPDTQYLNGSPAVSTPDGWLRLAKNYFRSKMRSAKDREAAKKRFMETYGVPEKWLDEAFDRHLKEADSLYAESMDIGLKDLESSKIQAKVLLLDACFNGAFIEDDYVAAAYLFNENNSTVAVRAHSVNTLQDKWETELVGLLARGVCIGNLFKCNPDLDTHLFGDPTFCFGKRSPTDKSLSGMPDLRYFKKNLKSGDSELRCLSVLMLSRFGKLSQEELFKIQKTDISPCVRLEAMLSQIDLNAPEMEKTILEGLEDNYELTVRLAAKFANRNMSESLLAKQVELYTLPTTTIRLLFHINIFITSSRPEAVKQAFRDVDSWKGDGIIDIAVRYREKNASDLKNLSEGAKDIKAAKFYIRSQRNACSPEAVEPMFECYGKTEEKALKLMIAEALGWYRSSCLRSSILSRCADLAASESDAELRRELEKSVNRLKSHIN